MQEVRVYARGSANGWYEAALKFGRQMKFFEGTNSGGTEQNVIVAITSALRLLKRPCVVNIQTATRLAWTKQGNPVGRDKDLKSQLVATAEDGGHVLQWTFRDSEGRQLKDILAAIKAGRFPNDPWAPMQKRRRPRSLRMKNAAAAAAKKLAKKKAKRRSSSSRVVHPRSVDLINAVDALPRQHTDPVTIHFHRRPQAVSTTITDIETTSKELGPKLLASQCDEARELIGITGNNAESNMAERIIFRMIETAYLEGT